VTESATSRLDAVLRVLASLAGTLPPAVLSAVCLARFLPFAEETRFIIGFTLAIPLWVVATCVVFLARSGMRAWILCASVSAVVATLAYGVSH
jgi:hypothetical protein